MNSMYIKKTMTQRSGVEGSAAGGVAVEGAVKKGGKGRGIVDQEGRVGKGLSKEGASAGDGKGKRAAPAEPEVSASKKTVAAKKTSAAKTLLAKAPIADVAPAKTPAAEKPAAKKPAADKAAGKKSAGNKATAKKAAAKKAAAERRAGAAEADAPRAAGKRIEVGRSGVHGKGVFAVAPIAEGELVIEYKGEVITWKEALRRHPHDPEQPNHTFYFPHRRRPCHRWQAPRQRREVDQPLVRPQLRSRRGGWPRVREGLAADRRWGGAELRLRAHARRPPHPEGEEGVRVPLRQPQLPRHDAGAEEVTPRR
jgi:hypothetical protein